MKLSKMQTRNFRPSISKLVMGFMLAALAGGMVVAPARADEWRRERHERREWREHEWRERRVYVAPRPAYVYAPPPVVYAPPPPPPTIDFVFPIHLY